MYAPPNRVIGKIEVTKYLHKWDCGKNIRINQKGNTPQLTHK